jgi:hypothetical protein
MRMYLSDHGLADPVDADRPLSEQGRDDVRAPANPVAGVVAATDISRHTGCFRWP